MKNFMENNKVTHNLMAFSGYKALLIFSMLLDGPKTYSDLQCVLENHPYLHETVSVDTIRIYINSIRKFGCKILTKKLKRRTYYYIDRHAFEIKITDKQAENILTIFKAISSSIELEDFMMISSFLKKFEKYIKNEKLRNTLLNVSPVAKIENKLVTELSNYAKNNNEIKIEYNSPHSKHKDIDIIADKMFINNGKLYLSGYNSEHKNYGSFLVERIVKVKHVNLLEAKLQVPVLAVRYELIKTDKINFEPLECEKIISEDKDKIVVEISSRNKFMITQRILFHTNKCKVISPQEYREEIISILKKMKEVYLSES